MRSAVLLLLPALAGCSSLLAASTADIAGIAGAGAANAVTKSAAIATGIGLGVAAAGNAGLKYLERRVHRTEQDRIAAAAGALAPGVVGQWSVEHDLPIEDDEHGAVVVTRVMSAPELDCREIVFSVDRVVEAQPVRAFYTAAVCRDGAVWKWATAEPATERWGTLQ